MWQSPNQRVRAIANSKKRERDRLRQQFHLRRVAVTLRLSQGNEDAPRIPARAVLNDLSASGIGLFVTQQLAAGEEVTLSLSDPKPLTVRGRVVSCQEYDTGSHILSEHSYNYRIGIQFVFDSPEQEKEVEAYALSISGELQGAKEAA